MNARCDLSKTKNSRTDDNWMALLYLYGSFLATWRRIVLGQ